MFQMSQIIEWIFYKILLGKGNEFSSNIEVFPVMKVSKLGTISTLEMHNLRTVPTLKMLKEGVVPTFKMHNMWTPFLPS